MNSLSQSINRNINECTYKQTGNNYQPQYWKNCYTCFQSEGEGV